MVETAIILPSRHEHDSISEVTRLVDEGLVAVGMQDESMLINVDNSDDDQTVRAFLGTETDTEKVAALGNGIGKGDNILHGMWLALEQGARQVCMFDTDLESLNPTWVAAYLHGLRNGADLVAPRYARYWIEGGTTNHLAFPALQAFTGRSMSQPIAGDFGMSQRLVEQVVSRPPTTAQRGYGIDMLISGTALFEGLNITEVDLDRKIHKPSFDKTNPTFLGAAASLFDLIYRYQPSGFEGDVTAQSQPLLEADAPSTQKLAARQDEATDLLQQRKQRMSSEAMTTERWAGILADHIHVALVDPAGERIAQSLLPFFLLRTVNFLGQQQTGHEASQEISRLPNLLRRTLA